MTAAAVRNRIEIFISAVLGGLDHRGFSAGPCFKCQILLQEHFKNQRSQNLKFSFLVFSNENGIYAVFWVQNLYLVFHHGTQLWLSYIQILEFVLCFPLLVFHYWYSGMKLAHPGFRIYIRFSITGTQYYEVPVYICQNLYSVFQMNLCSVFFN